MYSEDQMRRGHESMLDFAHFFGYAGEEETEVSFFKYDYRVKVNRDALSSQNGFKSFNASQLA